MQSRGLPVNLSGWVGWVGWWVGWTFSDNRANLSSTATEVGLPTGTELGNMNQNFLESIILALSYKTLWSIICERVTSINIFFIFGYVLNLSQKGVW